jgi:prepilin-type N-terminal cleavage/methylation domain-containing protein
MNNPRIATEGARLAGHGCPNHEHRVMIPGAAGGKAADGRDGAPRHPYHDAFTLIEMIGVLAVMALLAVAVIPMIIKRVDQAASTKEKADLDGMAESFTQHILRNKAIPAFGNIATTIANEMALPLNAITDNSRRYPRAFLTDQNFRVDGAALPYTNSISGASSVTNARVMIVSSLHRPLPITSGDSLSDADFQAIWDAPEGGKPSTATWSAFGSTDDLHIKKLNFEPLFHRLVLVNRDNTVGARFSIDSTNSTLVPLGPSGVDRYYLDGSVVGLHETNGVPVTKYLLNRDISFVFERNRWSGWIGPGDPFFTMSEEFVREAQEFLGSGWNTNSRRGASQTGVLVAMYVFMFDYALWAEECPNFSRHGATGGSNLQQVPEYAILDSLGKNQAGGILFDASQNLLNP